MAENQNQNKEFENMRNERCKSIFPNMNLNEEQMKLFTEKFIKKDDDEEESNSNDNNEEEDEESNSDDDDDNSDDDNEDDSNNNDEDDNSDDNDSNDNSDDEDEEGIIFDEDDDEDDENFDITNLNLCCNMCGEKIDESSNYVITPCTHFLHTACIKNKILSENNKEKDLDEILDKAMDEFLNKEKCEDCDICKSLF